MCGTVPTTERKRNQVLGAEERPCPTTRMQLIPCRHGVSEMEMLTDKWGAIVAKNLWSGLSESNRHLNLGKSASNGVSTTYEALSGALSSI